MDLSGVFCVADSGVLQDTILWNSVGMHTCSVWFSNMHDDRLIEWNMHVIKSLGPYDMIISRDILKFLKIDLRFSDEIVEWDGAEMPFKDGDAFTKAAHYVAAATQ